MSHTPGPWTTDEHEHDEPYQDIRILGKGDRRICTICIDDAPVLDFNAEQRSNARLIAAAPTMYEDLKRERAIKEELLEHLDEIVTNAVKNYEGSMEIDAEAVIAARRAIRKARGQS